MNATDLRQIDEAVVAVKRMVGNGVIGIYQYGSTVPGGLRRSSDLDLFVLLDGSTAYDERRTLVSELLQVSGSRGTRMAGRPREVTMSQHEQLRPWPAKPQREFQYGEWLRADYESGSVPEPTDDPVSRSPPL